MGRIWINPRNDGHEHGGGRERAVELPRHLSDTPSRRLKNAPTFGDSNQNGHGVTAAPSDHLRPCRDTRDDDAENVRLGNRRDLPDHNLRCDEPLENGDEVTATYPCTADANPPLDSQRATETGSLPVERRSYHLQNETWSFDQYGPFPFALRANERFLIHFGPSSDDAMACCVSTDKEWLSFRSQDI